MTTKEELHRLLDGLPEGNLEVLAEFLGDPTLPGLLSTPEGEAPLTFDEIVRLLEAKRDARAGRIHRFTDVDQAIRWLHKQAGRAD